MNQYDFTLTFRLSNMEENPGKHVEKLGEAGCDDALIGIGKLGSISLNFNREAKSALKAITTAIKDVRKVIPDAALVEATPDFVGITDIASIYGTTRQYVRKVVTSRSRSFPDPVHEGNPSLWHLADVLGWMNTHEPERMDEKLYELSKLNMQINSYRSLLKASISSGHSISVQVETPRKQSEWSNLIRSAVGHLMEPSSNSSSKRTRKTHTV